MQNILRINTKEMCVAFVVNWNNKMYRSVQVKYWTKEKEREMSEITRLSSLRIVGRKCLWIVLLCNISIKNGLFGFRIVMQFDWERFPYSESNKTIKRNDQKYQLDFVYRSEWIKCLGIWLKSNQLNWSLCSCPTRIENIFIFIHVQ